MKQKINNWLFERALKRVAKTIIKSENLLTPEDLIQDGWILQDGYYIEKGIKDRDRISVKFQDHYYRVFHSANRTFVALESSKEWFYTYYLAIYSERRHDLYPKY